ncbi:MAG: cation transporter [Gammaproteobacteria bacterium]|nr:cation transporter [Gammaproteobacteria bacterium]
MPAHKHHHHHEHTTNTRSTVDRVLLWAFLLTLGFALIEAAGGWLADSLALLGDAGHMFSDMTALGLAALAAWVARQPPSLRHSYGLVRAEAVAALINGSLMVVVVIGITWHAVQRLQAPNPVNSGIVMVIATAGLVVNLIVFRLLHAGEKTLNVRAAMLHVLGDLLGSAAALASGIVIYFTGWNAIDPILSVLICALILMSSLRLLREVLHVIMEGVPHYLDLRKVGAAMAGLTGVREVHDLHIWTLASGRVALSAHVVIHDMSQWDNQLAALQHLLHEQYDIEHVTLQPEPAMRTTRLHRMDAAAATREKSGR